MLSSTVDQDETLLDMPDADHDVVKSLLDIIYNGSIETSLDMIRRLLVLAHSLYISVPVSDQLVTMLGLELPPQTPLPPVNTGKNMEFPGNKTKKSQDTSIFPQRGLHFQPSHILPPKGFSSSSEAKHSRFQNFVI